MKNKKVTKVTIEDLAGMVKNGFDDMGGRVDSQFKKVNASLDTLEQGQEAIKLRLDNVEI